MKNEIKLGTFSEDFGFSMSFFKEDDIRTFLYSNIECIPCSAVSPLYFEDEKIDACNVPDLIDKGNKIVTKEIAEMIMAFDPFGIEVYPTNLKVSNTLIYERYIISIKNIIDVIDFDKSDIEECPFPDYDEPIIGTVVISSDKLLKIPYSKRIIFRVQGADDTVFFNADLIDYALNYFSIHGTFGTKITPFFTSEDAPII